VVSDALLEQRDKLCKKLDKIWREVYDRYEDNTKIHCTFSNPSSNPSSIPSKSCDYYMFGALYKGLKVAGFLTDVQHHSLTPENLVSNVEKVLEAIYNHLKTSVRFDNNYHHLCIDVRTDVVIRMKSALDNMEPVRLAFAQGGSWDRLLHLGNGRGSSGKVG
jgi:hypothetical protein